MPLPTISTAKDTVLPTEFEVQARGWFDSPFGHLCATYHGSCGLANTQPLPPAHGAMLTGLRGFSGLTTDQQRGNVDAPVNCSLSSASAVGKPRMPFSFFDSTKDSALIGNSRGRCSSNWVTWCRRCAAQARSRSLSSVVMKMKMVRRRHYLLPARPRNASLSA